MTSAVGPTMSAAWDVQARYTSIASGVWSDPACWIPTPPAGGPGAGQTAVIGDGTTIDINEDITIGPGGPPVTAIKVNKNAYLNINSGVDVTVRGHVQLADAANGADMPDRIVMNESTLTFDVPAGQVYYLYLAEDYVQSARLRCNGTGANHCVIRRTGAGVAAISYGQIWSGAMLATWTDLIDLGSYSIPAIEFYPYRYYSVFNYEFYDCTFINCGDVYFNVFFEYPNVVFERCRFVGSLSDYNLYLVGNPPTTGERIISECIFDKSVYYQAYGFRLVDCYLAEGISTVTGTDWAPCERNLFRRSAPAETNVYSTIKDSYFLHDFTTGNPHFITAAAAGAMEIDGSIFEYTGTDDNGDCVITGSAQLTMRRCIVLPNAAAPPPGDTGTLFSAGGGPDSTIVAEHNTYYTGFQGAAVGESYAGHTGMLVSFRANLAWDSAPTPRGFKLYDSGPDDSVIDLVAAADCDYNAGSGLAEGSNGYGYDKLEFSSGTPGVHDLNGIDPAFVDPTRNVRAWGLANGADGTTAGALGLIAADAALVAGRLASLRSWVADGFRPTNPAYIGSSYPDDTLTTDPNGNAYNGTIGAMAALADVPTATPVAIGGDVAWDVHQAIDTGGDCTWDTRAAAGIAADVAWDTRAAAGIAADIYYNIRQTVYVYDDTKWDISSNIPTAGVACQAAWDIREILAIGGVPSWDSRALAGTYADVKFTTFRATMAGGYAIDPAEAAAYIEAQHGLNPWGSIPAPGSVRIDHDYPTPDAMRATRGSGKDGIPGVIIRIFNRDGYMSGLRHDPRDVLGRTLTGPDGRWMDNVYLIPGEYIILYEEAARFPVADLLTVIGTVPGREPPDLPPGDINNPYYELDYNLSVTHGWGPWGPGQCRGPSPVDHHFGGIDRYTFTRNGKGLEDVIVEIYPEADFLAGRTGDRYRVGWSRTNAAGKWDWPVNLYPGRYSAIGWRDGVATQFTIEVL